MTTRTPRIAIRELASPAHWRAAFPLVKQQNPNMTQREYSALLPKMRQAGYRCIGAYSGEALVGILGFWVGHRFWCHKFLDLDNVIVDEKARSRGIGEKLVRWAEEEAIRQDCHIVGLDSYTTSHRAHRFYFREGYVILGYHFTKKLKNKEK